ncbi:MAG: amine dehydrogenase large subunit, partial [Myxococcota bacterium]
MKRELMMPLVAILAFATSTVSESAEPRTTERLAPIGDHAVWVPDRLFQHSLLFDGDSGELMGTIDSLATLTPKVPLLSRTRGEIYSIDVDYSRGLRGTRIDYVSLYSDESLDVIAEIILPHPTAQTNASLALTALLDGDRFMLVFSQFPATLVTVVDLESRQVVEEIPIAGCAGVYPIGQQRFATLCGDGSTLMVNLDT